LTFASRYAGAICERITNVSIEAWIKKSTYAEGGDRFGTEGKNAFAKALKKV